MLTVVILLTLQASSFLFWEWHFGTTTHLEKRIQENLTYQGLEYITSQHHYQQQNIAQWRSIWNVQSSVRSSNRKQQHYSNLLHQLHERICDKYVPYWCWRRYHQLATRKSTVFYHSYPLFSTQVLNKKNYLHKSRKACHPLSESFALTMQEPP